MKVLHYSDKGSKEIVSLYQGCDVLVTTGDLAFYDLNFVETIDEKKPAFGVYGNHCSGNYLEDLGITNLHNKVVEYEGYKWGGFQGCLKYKETGVMYTEDEAGQFADNFGYVDILLLHAGPKEMLDDPSDPVHIGSESIRRYVMEKRPKFIFLGHQYTNAEMDYEGIKLHRTYGARMINI